MEPHRTPTEFLWNPYGTRLLVEKLVKKLVENAVFLPWRGGVKKMIKILVKKLVKSLYG